MSVMRLPYINSSHICICRNFMKLPMNADIYSIGFVSETIWRRIVSGATGTRATNIKWPLGGLSNLFIFISVYNKFDKKLLIILNYVSQTQHLLPPGVKGQSDYYRRRIAHIITPEHLNLWCMHQLQDKTSF